MKKEDFSKKHQAMIKEITPESGLVDDCTHLLHFNEGVLFVGEEWLTIPVKNKKEVRQFLNDSWWKEENK